MSRHARWTQVGRSQLMNPVRFVRLGAPILLGLVGLAIVVLASMAIAAHAEKANATLASGAPTGPQVGFGLLGLGCTLLAGGLIARRLGESFVVGLVWGIGVAFVTSIVAPNFIEPH